MDKEALLGPPLTKDYEQVGLHFNHLYFYSPHRPIFTRRDVPAMLRDPNVFFGFQLLIGPILANSRFYISTDNPELKKYLAKQINRFWRNSCPVALRAMEYGWQAGEVMYRPSQDNTGMNRLDFDKVKYLLPLDTFPITREGSLAGVEVHQIYGDDQPLPIRLPKACWFVHQRENDRWFGRSRLTGAFWPWTEVWTPRGYKDQLRSWFYRCAFQGPLIQFPKGSPPQTHSTTGTSNVPTKSYRDHAIEMVALWASGNGMAYPEGDGWEITPPGQNSAPQGILEYGDTLRDDTWAGMGIPPEVARASDTTGAYAGRRIPQQAFYAILQQIVQDLITDLDEQILNPLVSMSFLGDTEYEIEIFGLLRQTDEERQGDVEQASGERLTNQPGEFRQAQRETGGHLAASELVSTGITLTPPENGVILNRRPRREDLMFSSSYSRAA